MTVILFATMLLGGGLAYGLNSVSWTHATSCGNGFSYSADPAKMTEDMMNACKRVQSSRQAITWGLVIAGLVGLVAGTVAVAAESNATRPKDDRYQASLRRIAGAPSGGESSDQ